MGTSVGDSLPWPPKWVVGHNVLPIVANNNFTLKKLSMYLKLSLSLLLGLLGDTQGWMQVAGFLSIQSMFLVHSNYDPIGQYR
jgi:hypothetical protein